MAKKAGSAYDGTLIQIKRTQKPTSSEEVRKDGKLKFGEPIYLGHENEKYLALGDGDTDTRDLQVFTSISQDLAQSYLFSSSRVSIPTEFTRVSFINKLKKNLIPALTLFTTVNSDDMTTDIAGNIVKLNVGAESKWYEVKDGTIDEQKLIPEGSSLFPRAQKIEVKGMTKDIIPYISLYTTKKQRDTHDSAKVLQKAFSCITDVESIDGYIIIYCNSKKPTADCYMNIYGG